MAASIQQARDPYQGFVPVGNDAISVTFDLERGEMVLIVAVAAAGGTQRRMPQVIG